MSRKSILGHLCVLIEKNVQANLDHQLKKSSDINNIGLYDLEDKMISIIEWPELIKNKHKNRIEIKLSYTKKENERNVSIKYFGSIQR